jgi:hypothetical protein
VAEHARRIRGPLAFVLPLAIGVAVLAFAGVRASQKDPTGTSLSFIIGLAGGYLVPLTVRIARMIGPERIVASRWLQLAAIGLTFLGLLGPIIVTALMPSHSGDAFRATAGGTLAMATLGTALQGDAAERVAA